MPSRPDDLVPDFPLTPAQQAALDAAVASDPELARAFVRWRELRAVLRRDLHRQVPDRGLFVLCALARGGYDHLISEEEAALVAAARPDFERAIQRHPGLDAAARDVVEAVADLEAMWQAYEVAETAPAPRPAPRRAIGRWFRWGVLLLALCAFVALAVLISQREAEPQALQKTVERR